MNCEQIKERLPWLLNRTLDATEQAMILSHLESCDVCRSQLEATGEAWRVFDAHPPTEILIGFVFGDPLVSEDRQALEDHLARCSDCREHRDLLSASRTEHDSENDEGVEEAKRTQPKDGATQAPRSKRGFPSTRLLVAAAVLTAVLAVGWLLAWQENRSLHQRVALLESPQLNVAAFDLIPESLIVRATTTDDGATEVIALEDAAWLTLILGFRDLPLDASYDLRIVDPQGAQVWRGSGLVPNPSFDFTISVPRSLLDEGRCRIDILEPGGNEAVESYSLVLSTP